MGTRGAHWYFTKEELNRPVRPGGLDPKIANKYRRTTCIFIQKAGMALRLYQRQYSSFPLSVLQQEKNFLTLIPISRLKLFTKYI
jgi:hypothetical protein